MFSLKDIVLHIAALALPVYLVRTNGVLESVQLTKLCIGTLKHTSPYSEMTDKCVQNMNQDNIALVIPSVETLFQCNSLREV